MHPNEWAVDLFTGIMDKGYRSHRVDLRELGVIVEDARETVIHITCLFTNLPGSPSQPMDYNDLE